MARYFFHLRDGGDRLLDPEGREVADPALLSAIALKEARSILREDVRGGVLNLDRHIDIEDARGAIVHRLEFADAIEIVHRR